MDLGIGWILQRGIRQVHLKELKKWDSLRHPTATQSVYKYGLRRMWPLNLDTAVIIPKLHSNLSCLATLLSRNCR